MSCGVAWAGGGGEHWENHNGYYSRLESIYHESTFGTQEISANKQFFLQKFRHV